MGLDAIKPAIYLAMITAIIAAGGAIHHAVDMGGYNRAQAELYEDYKSKIEANNKKFKDDLETAQNEAKHFRQAYAIIANAEPRVITKEKTKIIHDNPDCTNIHGISELWNTGIGKYNI